MSAAASASLRASTARESGIELRASHADAQAARRTPRRRLARPRRGDRARGRPDPDRGRHREHVLSPVRGARGRSLRRAARGHVRRPQHPAARHEGHGGSPLPEVLLRKIRFALFKAGQRDLALRAPGALLAAGRAAPRRRLAHDRRGRARQPRDRRGRARGRGRDGRLPVRDGVPRGRGRPPRGRALRLGAGEGHHPRAAAALRRPRRRREDLRVPRRRRRRPVRDGAGDDLQHDRRDGRDDGGLPERRAGARVARGAGSRARLGRARAPIPVPSTTGSR